MKTCPNRDEIHEKCREDFNSLKDTHDSKIKEYQEIIANLKEELKVKEMELVKTNAEKQLVEKTWKYLK